MDDTARTLHVPKHAGETNHKLEYHIIGNSSRTVIVLERNAYIKLEGNENAKFLLVITKLGTLEDVIGGPNSLAVGDQAIDISSLSCPEIMLQAKEGSAVFKLHTGELKNEIHDGTNYSPRELQEKLDKQSALHHDFVRVTHFMAADNHTVTYDPDTHNIIYTDPGLAPDDEYVLADDNNTAWLSSPTLRSLWAIDVETHQVMHNLTLASTFWKHYKGGVVLAHKAEKGIWVFKDRIMNHYAPGSTTYFDYMFTPESIYITRASVEFDVATTRRSLNETQLFNWMYDDDYLNRTNDTPIQFAEWLGIQLLVYLPHGNVSCMMRKWLNTKTEDSVEIRFPSLPGDVLCRLVIMPEISLHKTLKNEFSVLLHDQVLENLYRYTKSRLILVRTGIKQVIQERDVHIAVTDRGEVIELSHTGKGKLIGYTREGLHFFGKYWWRTMQYNNSYVRPQHLALYGVFNKTEGRLLPTLLVHAHVRAWYIPRFRQFAVVDPQQYSFDEFHYIDYLSDGSGFIIRLNSGEIKVIQLIRDGSAIFTQTGELMAAGNYSAIKTWMPVECLGKIIEARPIQLSLMLQTESGIIVGVENTTLDSATFMLKGIHVQNATMVSHAYQLARKLPLSKPLEDYIPTWTDSGSGWAYSLDDIDGPHFILASNLYGNPLGTDNSNREMLWSYDGEYLYQTENDTAHQSMQIFSRVSRIGTSIVLTASGNFAKLSVPSLTGITNVAVVITRQTELYKPNVMNVDVLQFTVVVPKRSYKKLVVNLSPWDQSSLKTKFYDNVFEVHNRTSGQTVSIISYLDVPDITISALCHGNPCTVFKNAKGLKNRFKLLVTGISFPGCNKHNIPTWCSKNYPTECNRICTCDIYNISRDVCDINPDLNATCHQHDANNGCSDLPSCFKSNSYLNCDPYLKVSVEGNPQYMQSTIVQKDVYDWSDHRPVGPVCNNDNDYMVLDVTDIMEDTDFGKKNLTIELFDDGAQTYTELCKFTMTVDAFKEEMDTYSDTTDFLESVTHMTLGGKCSIRLSLVSCFTENKLDVVAVKSHTFPKCVSKDGKQSDKANHIQCCHHELSIYNVGGSKAAGRRREVILGNQQISHGPYQWEKDVLSTRRFELPACRTFLHQLKLILSESNTEDGTANLETTRDISMIHPNERHTQEEICAEAAQQYLQQEYGTYSEVTNIVLVQDSASERTTRKGGTTFSIKSSKNYNGHMSECSQFVYLEQLKSKRDNGFKLAVPNSVGEVGFCTATLKYYSCQKPHVHYILAIDYMNIADCNRVKYRDTEDNVVKDSDYCHCSETTTDIVATSLYDALRYACDVYIQARFRTSSSGG